MYRLLTTAAVLVALTWAQHPSLMPRGNALTAAFFKASPPYVENDRTVWEYKLVVVETELQLAAGVKYKVFAYGGQVPGPTLRAREGDVVRIRLVNETSASHTIHSHGLFVPQRMDGVPNDHTSPGGHDTQTMTGPRSVSPGESFVYEYIARPAGTHWYHCHVNTNEHLNRGMAGALIIAPRTPEPAVDQESILLLQEWNSKYAQSGQPGDPREVHAADYFTIGGKSFPETVPIHSAIGQTVRLRVINAGSQSHSIHLHGHTFLVTHKDGSPLLEPVEMDTVLVGPGERVDLVFRANNPGDWPLHCHTAAHQTNAGSYPGGMMTHLLVGEERFPATGDGPVTAGVESIRKAWRESARKRLNVE